MAEKETVDYAQAVRRGRGSEELFNLETTTTGEEPSTEEGDAQTQLNIQATEPDYTDFFAQEERKPERTLRYTQEDFYPGIQEPAQYGFREGLQVIARPVQMPMGAISKATQSIASRQADLDRKKNAVLTIMSKTPQVPAPYQHAMNKLAEDEFENSILAAAPWVKTPRNKLFGPRQTQEEAMKNPAYRDRVLSEIAKSPTLRQKLIERQRKVEADAKVVNFNHAAAEKYLSEIEKPESSYLRDENLISAARAITSPTAQDADINQVLEAQNRYNKAVELNTYFNRNVLTAAAQVGFKQSTEIDPNTGKRWIEITNTKDWEEFKKRQAVVLVDQTPEALISYGRKMGLITEKSPSTETLIKVAANYLDGMLPAKQVTDVSMKPQATSSGPSGPEARKAYVTSPRKVISLIPEEWNRQKKSGEITGPFPNEQVERVSLVVETGGKMVDPEAQRYIKGQEQVLLQPLSVEEFPNNRKYIIGIDPNNKIVNEAISKSAQISNFKMTEDGAYTIEITGADGKSTTATIKKNELLWVPYDEQGNAEKLNISFPGVFESFERGAISFGDLPRR